MRENKAELRRFLAFHASVFVVALALFIALFSTPIFASLPLFYRGLLFIVAILIVQVAVLVYLKGNPKYLFTYRDIAIAALLFSFVSIILFMFLPVTIDRSISVYMLGYMAEHPQESFTSVQMNQVFVDGYINKYQAMQRRFDEQVLSKNVVQTSDGYRISPHGRMLVRFFEIVADIFSVDKRFVDPR